MKNKKSQKAVEKHLLVLCCPLDKSSLPLLKMSMLPGTHSTCKLVYDKWDNMCNTYLLLQASPGAFCVLLQQDQPFPSLLISSPAPLFLPALEASNCCPARVMAA